MGEKKTEIEVEEENIEKTENMEHVELPKTVENTDEYDQDIDDMLGDKNEVETNDVVSDSVKDLVENVDDDKNKVGTNDVASESIKDLVDDQPVNEQQSEFNDDIDDILGGDVDDNNNEIHNDVGSESVKVSVENQPENETNDSYSEEYSEHNAEEQKQENNDNAEKVVDDNNEPAFSQDDAFKILEAEQKELNGDNVVDEDAENKLKENSVNDEYSDF